MEATGAGTFPRTKMCQPPIESSLVRFHVSPQQRVDARLIAPPLRLEPSQHLTIQQYGIPLDSLPFLPTKLPLMSPAR